MNRPRASKRGWPTTNPRRTSARVRNEQLLQMARAALEGLPGRPARCCRDAPPGASLAEVATALNRSKGAVATLLFRGMTRLRKQLAEED